MSSSYYVLFYDYVEDVAERRGPYRDGHLRLLTGLHDSGYVVLGGAWASPVDGAAIVFKGDGPAVAEEFAAADPYVANGLVTRWRIREWNVVIGGG